jgi:hypothetical protein
MIVKHTFGHVQGVVLAFPAPPNPHPPHSFVCIAPLCSRTKIFAMKYGFNARACLCLCLCVYLCVFLTRIKLSKSSQTVSLNADGSVAHVRNPMLKHSAFTYYSAHGQDRWILDNLVNDGAQLTFVEAGRI